MREKERGWMEEEIERNPELRGDFKINHRANTPKFTRDQIFRNSQMARLYIDHTIVPSHFTEV